jgi:peptidyl-prolyl cis-trans isomerase C
MSVWEDKKMRISCKKLVIVSMCFLVVLCPCCRKKPVTEVSEVSAEPSNVVAKIGDYVITKEEVQKRLLQELRPDPYEYSKQDKVVDAETILLKMIADKAMIIEARNENYQQDKNIQSSVKRFKERRLVDMLLQNYLKDNLKITDYEIEQKLKSDPNLNRTQAKTMLERQEATRLVENYYSDLLKKFNVQKISANFSKAAQIHQRLLLSPKEPRRVGWIQNSQIENELTTEEKNLVLATYNGGQITLKDWFETLNDIAPPSRPRDLNTSEGVERLLDRTLRVPILVVEAKSLKLDQDKDLIMKVQEQEDMMLLGKIKTEKTKNIQESTEQQIIEYFKNNRENFSTPQMLKVEQIWCEDLTTTQKAKAEIETGSDFASVRQKYSLDKRAGPLNIYSSSEGLFWKNLYKAEPNEIVGPVKGFYSDGIKWRIVKILEKKNGKMMEYSKNMENQIKWRIMSEQTNKTLAEYQNQLLKKYKYNIYLERIKDIDPLGSS